MKSDELRQRYLDQVFRYHKDMYRIIMNVVKDHHTAEDLAQIVVIKAWKSFDTLREPEKSKAWVKSITSNVIKEYMRKKKVYLNRTDRRVFSDIEQMELRAIEIDIFEAIEKKERIGIVFRGLDLLDTRYSDIIRMHIIGGFSHKEIAGIRHMKPGTVRAYYSKGMRKLRDICEQLEKGGSIYNG